MEKVKERARKYEVVVVATNNGYFKAKLSINFAGGGRLESGAKSEEQAVIGLLDKLLNRINDSFNSGALTTKINNMFLQRFQESILNLKLNSSEVTQNAFEIVNRINQVNNLIDNGIVQASNIVCFNDLLYAEKYNNENNNKKIAITEVQKKYLIDEVVTSWRKHEIARANGTKYNQRAIKRTTLDGYIRIMNNTILPFFKKQRLLYINQVNESVINKCIANSNGFDNKRHLDIVFRLFFEYLVNEEIIGNNPMNNISKPVKPKLSKEKKIKCIKVENQEKYLDMFEKENTSISILLMLLLDCGCRPEEGCSATWENLLIEQKALKIDRATKDVAIYDEDGVKIGMERINDTLKTETSYRTIPISDRLLKCLLKHKEAQKERFKNSIKINKKGRKWSEKEYMFLGRNYLPYVSASLNKELKKMCNKYGLLEVTPYMLRRSFATRCFKNGVRESVIAEIMGHRRELEYN